MKRHFLYPILVLFLSACTTAVLARSDQDRVAYVQIGDSIRLKIDLERQKVEPVLVSAQASHQTEVHSVNRDDDGIGSSMLVPLDGCWHSKVEWRSLSNISNGPVITNPEGFVIARGTLIDTKGRRFLGGICPNVITSAVTTSDTLLFSRKEVTGALTRQDHILGLIYSDKEIVARSGAMNTSPADIFLFKGRTRALSLDPSTGEALVVREISKTQLSPTGWLRAIAGHPKQMSTYDLVIIDNSGKKKIVELAAGESEQSVEILF